MKLENLDKKDFRYVTFAIGGPLRRYYAYLGVLPEENDSGVSSEQVIRKWLLEHFPLDWASTYLPGDGKEQVCKYGLLLLFVGRIEHYNGKTFFHENGAAPTGCYCTDRCMAPQIQGRQMPCLDETKRANFK